MLVIILFFSCFILFPYSHEVTMQQFYCHKLMKHNDDVIEKNTGQRIIVCLKEIRRKSVQHYKHVR